MEKQQTLKDAILMYKLSTSSELVIRLSRLVAFGDRSFAVDGPRLRNTVPRTLYICAIPLLVYRRKLTEDTLFCFGNFIQTLYCSLFGLLRPVVLEVIT